MLYIYNPQLHPSTPRLRLTGRMSSVSREAVQRAQVWWRDSGAAFVASSKTKRSYTVDAWGRRRGGSSQGAWGTPGTPGAWKKTSNG